MEDAALEENPADDQPSDEECVVPAHQSSSVGDGAEPPVSGPSASPAVVLVEAPPLAPRSRTPSAEVEATAGGAEEDQAVHPCSLEGTRDASPSPRLC